MNFCAAADTIVRLKAVMSPIDETEIGRNRLSFLDHKSRRSVSQTTQKYYYQASTEITDQHASFSPFRTNAVISETINLLLFRLVQTLNFS